MRSPGMMLLLLGAAALSAFCSLLLIFARPMGTAGAGGPPPAALAPVFVTPREALTTTLFLPAVAGPPPARVLIAAAHIDSSVSYEPDEAILLWNTGFSAQSLAGWQLAAGTRRATIPATATLSLEGGARLWCAAEADAFRLTFGEDPACVWDDGGTDSAARPVPMEGSLSLNNRGGSIRLLDENGVTIDTLLYGDEGAEFPGWQGAPVQTYDRGAIPAAGQVLTRKQDPVSLQPVDSDGPSDWSSDLADTAWGRRVRFPGWQGWGATDGARPKLEEAQAAVTIAIGPEGLYGTVAAALSAAQERLDLSIYTLEHPELTGILADVARRGVAVRILLEGSPPGGISALQKWCVARLAEAGVEVQYLAPRDGAPNGLRPRYSYAHAKYGIIDGRMALVGTDNFNRDSMPTESGRGGRRGVYLVTDAAPVIEELVRIFERDWQPERFGDLHPFDPTDERYGGPPEDFALPEAPSYPTLDEHFRAPVTATGPARFGIVSAPENALRPDAGLLALLAQAGPGDEILLQQLYEHKFWGESTSNPIADPNPRLEAIIAAARRGATVRILLDDFFDDPQALRSNRATVEYVRAVAAAEGLDLDARLANPTGGGIHAKLVLVRLGETRWSAVGSLNGSEVSHKLNREIVLLTDQPAVHARLADLFRHDWETGE